MNLQYEKGARPILRHLNINDARSTIKRNIQNKNKTHGKRITSED
jgi:hypothetical protein